MRYGFSILLAHIAIMCTRGILKKKKLTARNALTALEELYVLLFAHYSHYNVTNALWEKKLRVLGYTCRIKRLNTTDQH